VEVAKSLGGSFKLVMLAPKTKGDDSTAQENKNGDTNKSKRTNKHTKHKPRLNMHTLWMADIVTVIDNDKT